MSDAPQGEGWWLASDGKYYPPAQPAGEPNPSGVDQPGGVDPEEEESGKGKIIAAVVAVLLLIAAGVVAFIVLGGDDDGSDSDESSTSDTANGSDTENDIGDATGELVDDGEISFNTDYDDALEGTRTEAHYTLEAPDGAIMTLTVTNEDASESGVFAQFESDGARFANFRTQPGATEYETVILANDGGATFDLTFSEGPAAYTFRVDLELASDGGQEGDAGSDFASAFAIEAGQEVGGALGGQDRTDHYTVDLQPGTELSFNTAVERDSDSGVLFTLQLEGERLFNGRTQPGAEEEFSVLLSDDDEGTLEIIATEGPANYTFTTDFVEGSEGGEAGDAPAELANAREIDASESLSGQVGGRDRGDYFTFTAPSGTFTVTGEADASSESGFLIVLEDESGSRAGTFRVQPGATAEEIVEVDAGSTVRLIVSEGRADYTITIE